MTDTCTGARDCIADEHVHGCYADYGTCDSPTEHPRRTCLAHSEPEPCQTCAAYIAAGL